MVKKITNDAPAGAPLAPDAIESEALAPGQIAGTSNADLLDTAQALDSPDGGAPGEAPAPPGPTNAEILADVFGAIRESACEMGGIESPRRTIPDSAIAKLANLWGGVCDSYKIHLAATMGKHAALAFAVMGTVKIIGAALPAARAEMRAIDQAKKTSKPAAPNQPGSAQVYDFPQPQQQTAAAPATDGAINPAW